MKSIDKHMIGTEAILNSDNLAVSLPNQWADVRRWNGDTGEVFPNRKTPAVSEVQVVLVAFASVTLEEVAAYGRAPEGDCFYGLLNNGDDIVLNCATDVAASASDINATANTFTLTAHGFRTGQLCRLTTSNALPTGLTLDTDYYIIKVDDNTVKLAASLQAARAGTAIDFSTTGTGNQTFHVPTAAARFTIGHSQDTEYYGFTAGAHAGSVDVRISVKPVSRYYQ